MFFFFILVINILGKLVYFNEVVIYISFDVVVENLKNNFMVYNLGYLK